jgi:hypothetical protein
VKTTAHSVINHPVERIDLARWISTMSDGDYQACSRAHRAAGTFREGGTLGMVNVESVGGNLLVQHYLATKLEPDHVIMHSKKSRAYVMHLMPASVEVIWTMQVRPRDGQSSLFSCTVVTIIPPLLRVLSTASLLPLFVRWHTQEETPGFAADISRKVDAGLLT